MTEWKEAKADLNIISFDEAGQETEGQFLGIETIHSEKKDKDYDVLVILNPAEQKEHIFLSGVLRYKLKDVKEGDYIRILYKGKREVSSDISPAGFIHEYSVFVKS